MRGGNLGKPKFGNFEDDLNEISMIKDSFLETT
jgi:hypothetical protein